MLSATMRERQWIRRFSPLVRLAHWVNLLCLVVLLMSGLQIFNAHPALYWGEDSTFDRPLFSIYWASGTDGRPMGITAVLGSRFDTTGVLGWSRLNGRPVPRAFPAWLTIPGAQDLATGRVWHLFFAWVFVANGMLFLGYAAVSRHLSRDLLPRRDDWQAIGQTLRQHLTFTFHRGTGTYNVIQKLAYLAVVMFLAPLAVLTGLAMSPGVVAAAPWLLDIFGGRQAARTVHFVVTWLFVVFVVAHVVMVMATGFINNMRSMTTGWYAVLGRARANEP